MKAHSEKKVCGGAGMLAHLRSNRWIGFCRWLVGVGSAIMLVMAISSGGWSVGAQSPLRVPLGCPGATWMPSVAITLNVTLQRPNAPPPDPSWAVPVHFALYPPGDPNTICHEWDLTLDQSGNWSGNLALFMGLYDARLKSPHTLRNVKYNVNIAGPMTINMGTLLEGDASNDNWVKAIDFSILRPSYWKQQGQSGFDGRADFDENDWVNAADFSLLRTNYWKSGDIVVP